jgi:hypothetical protein
VHHPPEGAVEQPHHDPGFGHAGADAVGRAVGTALKSFLADVDHLLTVVVVTDDDVERRTA